MLRTVMNQCVFLTISILTQSVYGSQEENNKIRRQVNFHWDDDDDQDDGDCLYHISDETWVWIITGIVVAILGFSFCAYCGVRFVKRRRVRSELRENLVESVRQPQAPSNSNQASYIPPQNINQLPYTYAQPNSQAPQNSFQNYQNQYQQPPNQVPAQALYPQFGVPIVQNNPQQGLYPVLQPLPNQPVPNQPLPNQPLPSQPQYQSNFNR
ncbi:unnamed protein product [Blepharisma stoltei]|uniref:Uncharacterized protein n=1 Tax=Blepharisma stoltei TaxID=1481888 RepID=A0AAU9IEC3_9CILI|nr:unnamed protein product [Blepharisma stoltei]